nr:hypothetical protein [Pararhodobacter sp.]
MFCAAGLARAAMISASRLASHGPEHLVLHLLEEQLGRVRTLVIVHGSGEQILHLLVEPLFRGADVADARQPLVEIVPLLCRLQLCVVHRKALDQIFLQDGARPAPELHAASGPDAEAHSKDGV